MRDVRCVYFFFFKQKTAYEMRISDWSSDVCSSDLTSDYNDGISAMEFEQGNAFLIKQDFDIFPFYGEAIGAAEFPEATAGDKDLFPFFTMRSRKLDIFRIGSGSNMVSLHNHSRTSIDDVDIISMPELFFFHHAHDRD